MIILYETDPHFKKLGSMANESRFNPKYSTRLDLTIQAFKWFYEQARNFKVDLIVHGGDILDKSAILAREGHAIEESFAANTTGIPEYVLVGNHDREDSTAHALAILSNYPSVTIVDQPLVVGELSFLPFTTDVNYDIIANLKNKFLFSHVDILGAPYNAFVDSTIGFDPKILKMYFEAVINGHIHASSVIENVVNTGAFIGSGLGDVYTDRYPSAYLIDTDNTSITPIINPWAIHYETVQSNDLWEIKQKLDKLLSMPFYFYLRVQCINELKTEVRLLVDKYMTTNPKILSAIVIGNTRARHVEAATGSAPTIQMTSDPVEILLGFIKNIPDSQLPATRKEVEQIILTDFMTGGK
jgi:predicted phosphodiesterase